MGKLTNIETLAASHAKARDLLAERAGQLQEDAARLQRRRLPGIKRALEEVRRSHEELRLAIKDAKDEFKRPRSRVFHGIKLGFKKAKGSLQWASESRVVELIKKNLPDQVEVLIKSTEKPVKTALQQLPAADLKKLGVSIVGAGDEVFVTATDSDLDKFIEALLEDTSDYESSS